MDAAWSQYINGFDEILLAAKVAQALDIILPATEPTVSRKAQPPAVPGGPVSKKVARRGEFAEMQKLFKKNPKRVVEKLLEPSGPSMGQNPDHFERFWENVMTLPPNSDRNVDSVFVSDFFESSDLSSCWDPIDEAEIRMAAPKISSAPGPDGVKSTHVRIFGSFTASKLFNLLLFLGRLPPRLSKSRTDFIPKKADASEPGDFRPISMSSIITRTLHRVLARRLGKLLHLAD